MSDMTRHDIYGHEVKALKFYAKQMLELPREQVPTPYNEILATLAKIETTDAGPLPRGEYVTKKDMTAAIYQGLRLHFEYHPHIEVKALDKSTIQVFVRPKDGVVYDFVIKVQQPR